MIKSLICSFQCDYLKKKYNTFKAKMSEPFKKNKCKYIESSLFLKYPAAVSDRSARFLFSFGNTRSLARYFRAMKEVLPRRRVLQ